MQHLKIFFVTKKCRLATTPSLIDALRDRCSRCGQAKSSPSTSRIGDYAHCLGAIFFLFRRFGIGSIDRSTADISTAHMKIKCITTFSSDDRVLFGIGSIDRSISLSVKHDFAAAKHTVGRRDFLNTSPVWVKVGTLFEFRVGL